jgi:BspA type Leucine rich repeat region (6 copies)
MKKLPDAAMPRCSVLHAGFVAMLFLVLHQTAQAQFTFTTNNGSLTITKYTGPGGDVVIPDSTNGLAVTGIGDSAFQGGSSVTSITIPDSLITIGVNAFSGCFFTNVTLGHGLVSIGDYAFQSGSFSSIVIPTNVQTLGKGAFAHGKLTSVNVYGGWGTNTFSGCGLLTDAVIGTNVNRIGWGMFLGCSRLRSITIPGSVGSIDDEAFYGCSGLTNLVISNGVTSIGSNTFENCTSLLGVTIPASVSTIGYGSFDSCSNMQSLIIEEGVNSIGDFAFSLCKRLTTVTIPSSVTNIGMSAFATCYGLTNVVISPGVTTIGGSAFGACKALVSITIPSSVSSIGTWAFNTCPNLQGVYFEGNAPGAGSVVFNGSGNVIVYYLPGALGWGPTFGGAPTAPWPLPYPVILDNQGGFGVQTNGFGFTVAWNTNLPVIVETCANLADSHWSPVATNALTNGLSYFNDAEWTNHPSRFYRIRSP